MNGAVIGVVGARGGAGASVLAASLASAVARRDATATLIDLAAENGGIDVLLGIEGEPGLRWPDLAQARGSLDGPALRDRLPRWDAVPVVAATRAGPVALPQEAVADVCLALADASDIVVADLSRVAVAVGAPLATGVLRLCDEVLIVTPLDLPAVAGALVARDALARGGFRAALVVRGPAPGTLDAVEVGDVVGVDVVAQMPWDSRLAGAIERGEGPGGRGPVRRAAQELAARYVGKVPR